MRKARRLFLGAFLLTVLSGAAPAPPTNLDDPRLAELKAASAAWAVRPEPSRAVVDVVCLVPDVATFLEVIGTWDADHFFPVLIDDADFSLRFLRAFRPARVVRYRRKESGPPPEPDWDAAVRAVGRSWRTGGEPSNLRGDRPPSDRAKGAPGVVLSSSKSPTFAAAVALAAGRFQPLLRWETEATYKAVLSLDDASKLTSEVEPAVASVFPKYGRLGDDCDFVTLAGDYPYRYDDPRAPQAGQGALDDRIGFVPFSRRRWGFAGRLVGDPVSSIYRSMCSLFLQPDSALLFHTYGDQGDYAGYVMPGAQKRLAPLLKVTLRTGTVDASLAGWRSTFAPENRFPLLFINSSGSPTAFGVQGGQGTLIDVPEGVPAILHHIESFSAADPQDPETLAGRWLAGGVYIYFGAMNEPYLTSFRAPTLLADLLARGLPLAAAFREGATEVFSLPWRLVYLGDPLYRFVPPDRRRARVAWHALDDWPAYSRQGPPPVEATDESRLIWALRQAIVTSARGAAPDASWVDVLLSIRRERLRPENRPLLDGLLADTSARTARSREVRTRLDAIPAGDRSLRVRRVLELPLSPARRRPAG